MAITPRLCHVHEDHLVGLIFGIAVPRTLVWLNRKRCLAKDLRQTIATKVAWFFIAWPQLQAPHRKFVKSHRMTMNQVLSRWRIWFTSHTLRSTLS